MKSMMRMGQIKVYIFLLLLLAGISGSAQNLMPNPAKDMMYIDSYNQEFSLDIISSLGQVMDHIDIVSERTTVDISHLSPGSYMLRFKNSQETVLWKRLIITH